MWNTGRSKGICAVTGASGYVGSRVANHLIDCGWEVRALTRTAPSECSARFTHVTFELGHELPPDAFQGVDALVHLAYDFGLARPADMAQVNVNGSRLLFAAAREAGVARIVFVSTVAAFPGARSRYGQSKLAIEQLALQADAAIIRPGLVWGPEGAAMFGSLQRVVERLPVIPLLVPGELELTLVHEDDLAALVDGLLESWPEPAGELFVAASTHTITFADLLLSLASRVDRAPRLMRFPWRVAWLGLRLLEAVGVTPPFRSDSLVSLVAADSDPLARATAGAERFGTQFRPYAIT